MSAILKTLIKSSEATVQPIIKKYECNTENLNQSSEATVQPCPLIDFQMKKNAPKMKYICVTNPFLYSVVKTYVVSLN